MKGQVLDDELEALASHVLDTYDRVRAATRASIALDGSAGSRVLLRDLFVVSLNVFGRSLLEFFDDPKRNAHADDVHAVHYVPDWNAARDGADSLVMLKALFLPGVNKRFAHITAHRVRSDPSTDAWPVAEIYWSLACLMQRFVDRLSTDRRLWFVRHGRLPDTTPSALGMFAVG
jgi:hypothetical protein